ncbi:heme exporter protein CcmD [Pseudomonas syringae pv. actinidiae ICMP 19070]|nr:heme exporter protein CcmD [Pseudomonas syringae pv. actinidiae ICMP 19070]
MCLLVLLINVTLPVLARRRYLQQQAQRLKRESRP